MTNASSGLSPASDFITFSRKKAMERHVAATSSARPDEGVPSGLPPSAPHFACRLYSSLHRHGTQTLAVVYYPGRTAKAPSAPRSLASTYAPPQSGEHACMHILEMFCDVLMFWDTSRACARACGGGCVCACMRACVPACAFTLACVGRSRRNLRLPLEAGLPGRVVPQMYGSATALPRAKAEKRDRISSSGLPACRSDLWKGWQHSCCHSGQSMSETVDVPRASCQHTVLLTQCLMFACVHSVSLIERWALLAYALCPCGYMRGACTVMT